jgi:hypothetical protein
MTRRTVTETSSVGCLVLGPSGDLTRWQVSSYSPHSLYTPFVCTGDQHHTDIRNESLPTVRRPQDNCRRKPPLLLLQLHSAVRPGLSQRDFRSLFAKCACGLIMTRSAFRSHYCAIERVEPDVIEITDSEGEDSN